MSNFENVRRGDIEGLEKEFRILSKSLHPDTGGDAEKFQEMLAEYRRLKLEYKDFCSVCGNTGYYVVSKNGFRCNVQCSQCKKRRKGYAKQQHNSSSRRF